MVIPNLKDVNIAPFQDGHHPKKGRASPYFLPVLFSFFSAISENGMVNYNIITYHIT